MESNLWRFVVQSLQMTFTDKENLKLNQAGSFHYIYAQPDYRNVFLKISKIFLLRLSWKKRKNGGMKETRVCGIEFVFWYKNISLVRVSGNKCRTDVSWNTTGEQYTNNMILIFDCKQILNWNYSVFTTHYKFRIHSNVGTTVFKFKYIIDNYQQL